MKKMGDFADKLLRISQVATRLNCSRRHVYNLIDRGRLAAMSIGEKGRGKRVRESDLNRFLEKSEDDNGFF